MRQHIFKSQLYHLSQKGYLNLWRYLAKKESDSGAVPIKSSLMNNLSQKMCLTISQMIEFLFQDYGCSLELPYNDLYLTKTWKLYLKGYQQDIGRVYSSKIDLCDLLWQPVKEILENA